MWRFLYKAPLFPLRGFLRLLILLLSLGVVGRISNETVRALNGGKMPVVSSWAYEVQRDSVHLRISGDIKLLYASDALSVDASRTLTFLFPWDSYVSVGDLFIAASIIVGWWVALATIIWAPILLFLEKFVCHA